MPKTKKRKAAPADERPAVERTLYEIVRCKEVLDRFTRALIFISDDGAPVEAADLYALEMVLHDYHRQVLQLIKQLPKGEGRDSK